MYETVNRVNLKLNNIKIPQKNGISKQKKTKSCPVSHSWLSSFKFSLVLVFIRVVLDFFQKSNKRGHTFAVYFKWIARGKPNSFKLKETWNFDYAEYWRFTTTGVKYVFIARGYVYDMPNQIQGTWPTGTKAASYNCVNIYIYFEVRMALVCYELTEKY